MTQLYVTPLLCHGCWENVRRGSTCASSLSSTRKPPLSFRNWGILQDDALKSIFGSQAGARRREDTRRHKILKWEECTVQSVCKSISCWQMMETVSSIFHFWEGGSSDGRRKKMKISINRRGWGWIKVDFFGRATDDEIQSKRKSANRSAQRRTE